MLALASGNDEVATMIAPQKKSSFSCFGQIFEPFQASKRSAEPLK